MFEKIISENGFSQDFSRIFCFLLDFNFSDYIYKKAITSYYKSDSLLDTIYGFHLLISDFSNCSISFCTVFLCHSHSFYHPACLIVIIRNCRIKNLFSFFQIFLSCWNNFRYSNFCWTVPDILFAHRSGLYAVRKCLWFHLPSNGFEQQLDRPCSTQNNR